MTDEERQEAQNILDQAKEFEQFWNSLQAEEATIESEAEARERLAKERLKKIQEMIDHPSWYNGDIECIDAMIQTKGVEKVKAFCELCAFKYLWRSDNKGGDEDIEKAVWYLEKYLELGHE